jgi:glycosyltransferase involved in cell wall biosynthesis
MGASTRLSRSRSVDGERRRILFVSHSASPGGAQSVLVDIATGLGRHGFEPCVALPERGLLAARLPAAETIVTPLRWWAEWAPAARSSLRRTDPRKRFLHRLTERVERLVRIAEHFRVDAIVSNTLVTPDGALAAAESRLPHVWHAHEFIGANPDLRLVFSPNDTARHIGLLADRVVAVSGAVRDELVTLGMERSLIEVVHNGVDPETFPTLTFPSETEPPTVAFVGALSERKGVDVLLEAFSGVQRRLPRARLVLAGGATAARRRALRESVQRLGLTNVEVLGEVTDVRPVIGQAHVVALPALLDPFPLAVLEAMAIGRAVVGTRSGGMAEQIADGHSGTLVAPDDASELGRALLRYLVQPAVARRAGELAAARVVEQFTLEKTISRFARILGEVADETAPDRRDAAAELLDLSSSYRAVSVRDALERRLRSARRLLLRSALRDGPRDS